MEYKGYKIVNDGTFSMVNVEPIGRGSVPKSLRGSYTSMNTARMAIDSVVSLKENKRGKNSNNSGV